MQRQFSITVKIWLAEGVFILGFVLTAVLDQVHGWTTENDLRNTSDALLPSMQHAQEADTAFQKMVKSFSTAVMTQDASLIEQGGQQGRSAVELLRGVASTSALGAEQTEHAGALATAVEHYLADARKLYGAALANSVTSRETEEQMQALAARTEQIRVAVEAQKAPILGELTRRLGTVQARTRQQRVSALVVFAITLLAAVILVSITVKRAIVAPILRAIQGVRGAAEDAARESEQMAQSGQKVAADSQHQAASVEQTSAALEEISVTAVQNATRAGHADTLMKDARQKVEAAARSMGRLGDSMKAISSSNSEVAHALKSLDEIAFQTNILALNAAVEAARAGHVGAGFSVVADEVRSLAQRATQTARHTADIVEKTIADVRNGVELVAITHGAFGQVSEAILESSEVVGQIATTIQEQSRGVESIGQAVSRIQVVTQSNAEQARQTAESASQMADQVRTTRRHLGELMQVIGSD